jgi:hypothetical protein
MWHSSSLHGHTVAAEHVLLTQALRSRHVSAGIEASRRARIPSLPAEPPVLILWLDQVTRRFSGEPPQILRETPVVSRYPAPSLVDDFVLLFLPPCGPHLTPLATGSLESGLLVSPLLGGPTRHRPFTPTLHLHQRKSSRTLHLQYSAKSQSTPRCQSPITAKSDHPPVLGRFSPHLALERGGGSPEGHRGWLFGGPLQLFGPWTLLGFGPRPRGVCFVVYGFVVFLLFLEKGARY